MNNSFSLQLPVMDTERLRLRPMTEADSSLVVSWRNSGHIAAVNAQMREKRLTEEEHLVWFQETRSDRVDYIIEVKENNQPIGSLSFVWQRFPRRGLCAELGKYIGDASHLGKGYAVEAASCWLSYAFEEVGVKCVFARTRSDNVSNLRVNQKLGFRERPWPRYLNRPPGEWTLMLMSDRDWQSSWRGRCGQKNGISEATVWS